MDKYTIAEHPPKDVEENLETHSPLTRLLLFNRGITTPREAEKFLKPDYERDVHDPFLILNMERAVERILKAIEARESIVIYGDYDCDGIPGSVVLHDFFKKIEYKHFENYIPHRHKEGYGLNITAIKRFAKKNVTVLITVDSGITDVAEVECANQLGIDVIITDHHLPGEILPPAYAILNSKQKGDTYPYDMLCGAGVAWKLVCALLQKGNFGVAPGWEKWLLDMTGIATISDMVPLNDENRALAHYGLKVLRKSPRLGLLMLLKKMKVDQRYVTESDVGFMIAPRINAASRMGVPMDAFRLLVADSDEVAVSLSERLHSINNERKLAVATIIKEAKSILSGREIRDVIVIGNPRWRVGVLGIVASNIMEEYERPVFVWGREESEDVKGSCRSDGIVNLVELMNGVSRSIFMNVGGHERAGGFTISHDKIHVLEDELVKAYKKTKRARCRERMLIDQRMELDEVDWSTYKEIERFAPFGVENSPPTFLFDNVEIVAVKMFGKEKNHLQLDLRSSHGVIVQAIGFFMNTESFGASLEEGRKIDLVATFDKSTFRGRPELRLRIIDIF
ncbi:MAG: hypothetical protein BMS9Abin13_180 [Patescibacteria group bacterium]|nr:MAG: hypothetical protein BMS9Abin13_180 [Patescibacteria group bacterium]